MPRTRIKYLLIIAIAVQILGCSEDKILPDRFGSISGRITESDTTITLQQVEITTIPASKVAYSDSSGFFEIDEIKTGEYTLNAKLEGYVTGVATIAIYENNTSDIKFALAKNTADNSPPVFQIFEPSNSSLVDSDSILLQWSCTDSEEDELLYNIYLYSSESQEPILEVLNSPDTCFLLLDQPFKTTFYWQVQACDSYHTVNSEILSFSTKSRPEINLVYVAEVNGQLILYGANKESINSLKLYCDEVSRWDPQLSPNKKFMAYTQLYGKEEHVYLLNLETNETQRISSLPIKRNYSIGPGFSWSVEGNSIIYIHHNNIIEYNIKSSTYSTLIDLNDKGNCANIIESPDQTRWIAQFTGNNIWNNTIVSINKVDYSIDTIVFDSAGIASFPQQSIDGKKLLYSSDISGYEHISGRQLDARIFLMDITTGTIVDLSENKGNGFNDLAARFSPDGSKIIFTNSSNQTDSEKSIWEMDLDGQNRQLLIENADMPDWK